MAIAVPMLLANTAAGAAIAGAIGVSTGLLATVTAVAFQVTGINDKINKAASNVFGEDLVNFANIAGAGFALYNGGFDIGGATGAESVGGEMLASSAPELTDATWAADSASNMDAIASASQGIESGTFNLADMSNADAAFEADYADMLSGKQSFSEVSDSMGTNILSGKAPGVDPKMANKAPIETTSATPQANADLYSIASQPDAAGQGATGLKAAGTDAASKVALKLPNTPGTDPSFVDQTTGFFKKMFTDPKTGDMDPRMIGMGLQAVGGAYSGAQANALRQRQIDEEQRRYNAVPTFRIQ